MPRKSPTHCKDCGIDLDLNPAFQGIRRLNQCKDCYNTWHRNYRAENNSNKNRKDIRNMNLKCLYGITEEQYNNEVLLHLGGCAICKQPVEVLSVDHDHATGMYRGLLCKTCNLGLGAFKDNEELLFNAIEYLKRTSLKKVG